MLSSAVPESYVVAQWLSERRGKKVALRVPERGKKSKLLELAEKNAAEKAKSAEVKWESEARNTADALEELQQRLQLAAPPARIEGYDISHLGCTETVGSMVVMKNGKPANDQYRSFTIYSLTSGDVDDYRALQEVLRRRLRHLQPGREEQQWAAKGITVGKALKKEQDAILAVIRTQPKELSADAVDYRHFFVARRGEEVVAVCRLWPYPTGLLELRSVCVLAELRGQRLGQFLVRKALRSVKKGKVYITIDPALEEYYASIGFRHILKVPPALQEKIDHWVRVDPPPRPPVAMVYDIIQHKTDVSLSAMPDLLVIDGGKGQLNAVRAVLADAELAIPVMGLAKREEDVFVPGQTEPVQFGHDSPAKFLLMRLRDEAHRFANRHREKRGFLAAKRSAFDDIPGVGEKTKRSLLEAFGSLDGVRAATDAQLRAYLADAQIAMLRKLV